MKYQDWATIEPDIDGESVFLKSGKRLWQMAVEEKLRYGNTVGLSAYN